MVVGLFIIVSWWCFSVRNIAHTHTHVYIRTHDFCMRSSVFSFFFFYFCIEMLFTFFVCFSFHIQSNTGGRSMLFSLRKCLQYMFLICLLLAFGFSAFLLGFSLVYLVCFYWCCYWRCRRCFSILFTFFFFLLLLLLLRFHIFICMIRYRQIDMYEKRKRAHIRIG